MGFYKIAFSEYRRYKQPSITQCILMCLLMVIFNIGFWTDEWSTDGSVVNEVSQICFNQYEEYCCQTFEDLRQQTPVVSTLTAIGLFNENFSNVPGFEQHKLGTSFWLFLVCFFLQVLLPLMVFIEWKRTLPDRCKRIWNENMVEPINIRTYLPSNQPNRAQDQARLGHLSQRIVLDSRGSEILRIVGSEVTLPCTAQPYISNIIWQKKGIGKTFFTNILPCTNKYRYMAAPPGLFIQNLQVSDSGEYRYMNKNTASSIVNDVVKLRVIQLQFETNSPRANTLPMANSFPVCSVCLERPRNVVIEPCGHLVLCDICCNIQYRTNRQCPICRGPINRKIKCYIS